MSRVRPKLLVKYDCLLVKNNYDEDLRVYMQWALELEDNFLDKWKKYD
jgi:hypothetical protein